jgi:MerR family transcriptional regulator, thiopeptide resistance regulator
VDGYTVGEVARLAHVSVRTLHHYDGIGLLTPGARSAGGYRLYSESDLHRLRQVLFYRELEFGLDDLCQGVGLWA